MVLTNTEADCRSISDMVYSLNVRINNLRDMIQGNFEILDRGVGNRIRARIEDNIFNQLPSRDEAEILDRANKLRQEIRDWQSEISQREAERAEMRAVQR